MMTMAPQVEYIQQAPVAYETMVQQPAYETMVAQPQYIQSQPMMVQPRAVAPPNLLAMGNVVSERIITIEELASMDRYAAEEAVMVEAPREIVVQQPMVQYIQEPQQVQYIQQQQPMVEYVQAAPAVEYIQQPQQFQTMTMAPQTMTYQQPMMQTMQAPMTYQQPMMQT